MIGGGFMLTFPLPDIRLRYLRNLSRYNHPNMLHGSSKRRAIKTPALVVLAFGILETFGAVQIQE